MGCETGKTYGGQTPVKAKGLTWEAGATGIPVDMSCLDNFIETARRPMLDELRFRIRGTVTVANGPTLRARTLYSILATLFIGDRHGFRVDCTGAELACFDFFEYANPFVNRRFPTNAATTFDCMVNVPVRITRGAKQPNAHRWPLEELRDGKITLGWSSATLGTAGGNNVGTLSACTVDTWFTLVDEGSSEETKMRHVLRSTNIDSNEKSFKVGGPTRFIGQYLGEVAEDKETMDTWAAQDITSNALHLLAAPDALLKAEYFDRSNPRRTAPNLTADEDDPVVNGLLLPLYTARDNQSIPELPSLRSFDWKTSLAYASGTFTSANAPRMLLAYYEKRHDGEGGQECGDDSGYVKLASGGFAPVANVRPDLRRVLPTVQSIG